MATDVDRAYYGWPQQEMSDADDPQEVAATQMVDNGSVSFGRFAVETLSWERRSVFTHNRRQEELEKFNGLVAKKKAYFEERYRRIRALKALKQNQQTELTLDYGADGSFSSHTEEEEEEETHHESPREREANIAASLSENVEGRTTFEQEISSGEFVEPVLSVLEPVSRTVPHEVSLSEESIGSIEHYETLNGDQHFAKPIEPEGQVEMVQPELRGSVDIEVGKVDNVEQKVEKGAVNIEAAPLRGTRDLVHSKMRPAKRPLYTKPAPNVKGGGGSGAAIRNGRILDRRPTRNPTQASKEIKRLPPKLVGKGESNQINGNNRRNVQQVDNKIGSSLVPVNRTLAGSYPKIANPGMFTRAMERRVNNRANAGKLDASSSKKLPATATRANSGSNMQDMKMKRTIVSGTISRGGLESKREVNNAIKKPLAADSKHSTTRRSETQMPGTTKPRMSSSLNLPAKNSAIRKESQLSTPRVTKTKEGKEATEMKRAQAITAKSFASSMNGNMNIGKKTVGLQTTQARYSEQFQSGSKQKLDNLSLDGRKTRREALNWR